MVIPTQGHQYLASGFEKPSGVIGDPFIVSDLFLYLDFIWYIQPCIIICMIYPTMSNHSCGDNNGDIMKLYKFMVIYDKCALTQSTSHNSNDVAVRFLSLGRVKFDCRNTATHLGTLGWQATTAFFLCRQMVRRSIWFHLVPNCWFLTAAAQRPGLFCMASYSDMEWEPAAESSKVLNLSIFASVKPWACTKQRAILS